ncbi:MAG: hypothetical protein KDD69_01630 [Bdellovibrionales bacterium]|nr:hypothetical protein [Bdellovibrionales bacterium]
MNPQLVTHVFASLQGLEKSMGTIKRLLPLFREEGAEFACLVPKQEEILAHMRRTANLLQLQMAKGENHAAVRSLQIFYGLHQMVRPDILRAFGTLSRGQASIPGTETAAEPKHITYH